MIEYNIYIILYPDGSIWHLRFMQKIEIWV